MHDGHYRRRLKSFNSGSSFPDFSAKQSRASQKRKPSVQKRKTHKWILLLPNRLYSPRRGGRDDGHYRQRLKSFKSLCGARLQSDAAQTGWRAARAGRYSRAVSVRAGDAPPGRLQDSGRALQVAGCAFQAPGRAHSP